MRTVRFIGQGKIVGNKAGEKGQTRKYKKGTGKSITKEAKYRKKTQRKTTGTKAN